jgi:isoquinoline 1-oxidoreductase beta subunit
MSSIIKTKYNRRSFLKASSLAGGGFALGFSMFASCKPTPDQIKTVKSMPKEWFDMNTYLKIGDNGLVTIMSANPEIGQNIKTSMPMIVAEELDVAWEDVVVEQAPLDDNFNRQVAGGSQSIRQGWESLRMAGATAKAMLIGAAAAQWQVDVSECTAADGVITNAKGDTLTYGAVASAAAMVEVPAEIKLKDPADFKIIGTKRGNVDMDDILTGKPLFGIDTKIEGMQYASVLRPPAFGMKLKSYDDSAAKAVTGVFSVLQFGDKVAVLAKNTWAAMKAKKAIKAEWEQGTKAESTIGHDKELLALLDKKSAEPKRSDGDVKKAFSESDSIFERTYEAPFLPHNCLEPMNFYADVTETKAELVGPIQTPAWTRSKLAKILEREEKDIKIDMTRMGGGFGRRLYGDFAEEAAQISLAAKTPVQLIFTREDDMTAGTYRPASKYKIRASIKDGEMTGYHITGAGTNLGNTVRENNFPAATVDNYLAETHNLETNISTGAWRAPVANFLAYAEQAFFDELAGELGKDAVQFRLDLFEKAKANPDAEMDYDVDKSIGVIKLAVEKSGWGKAKEGVFQGFSTYFSHNSYVAEVAEVVMKDGKPVVDKVIIAVDCGIVVNPIGAHNQAEGGVIDGIGHAMYGDFSFTDGKPSFSNFDQYRLIRMADAPKVEVHFMETKEDPTGLGEPTLPPAGGAIANALAAATKERFYKQPFAGYKDILG